MDWNAVLQRIDANTAQAFVRAAGHFIDAVLIESERIEETRTPGRRDYSQAELGRETPGGGWVSNAELRTTLGRMSESIAAEKWVEGAAFVVTALALMGG